MKSKIIIKRNGETLYTGKILNMPVKHEAIVQKSIELFDDEDPCIIHQSFAVKQYAETLLNLLEKHKEVQVDDFQDELFFLDINPLDKVVISKKG